MRRTWPLNALLVAALVWIGMLLGWLAQAGLSERLRNAAANAR